MFKINFERLILFNWLAYALFEVCSVWMKLDLIRIAKKIIAVLIALHCKDRLDLHRITWKIALMKWNLIYSKTLNSIFILGFLHVDNSRIYKEKQTQLAPY